MEKPLVVLLAGGAGRRASPITVNKTVIPFMGMPYIEHVFNMLKVAGLTEICAVTSFENDELIRGFNTKSFNVVTVLQDEPLGMADAVLTVEKHITGRPILIVNGVDLVDASFLTSFLQKAERTNALIAGRRSKTYFPGGYLRVEGEKVLGIVEKPAPSELPSDILSLVVDYFQNATDFINEIKKAESGADDRFERALNSLCQTKTVSLLAYEGSWVTIKYPFHILEIMSYLLDNIQPHISSTASVSTRASIHGNVFIDDSATIQEGAVIMGPVYIGKNVIVGNNTLIRSSVIEDGTIVGFGTEIARSYVGPRCHFHGNFIGDSVLESDINPSFGTCTANLRLDKAEVIMWIGDKKIPTGRTKFGAVIAKGVFFGVQCNTQPGATIGEGSRIYPQTTVHKSLPPKTILKSYQDQKTEKITQ